MKNNSSETVIRKTSVGGQALIEGVMMNGPKGVALSVREKSGNIITEMQNYTHIKDKHKILGAPFIRGIVNFVESMIIGYKSLMRSAELSGELEDEQDPENMSKVDRWLNDHMGPKLMGVITGIASVFAVVLCAFLFVFLPTFVVTLVDTKIFAGKIGNLFPLFEGVIRLIILVLYMYFISKMKEITRVFMYHGAEHKSIFCYEKGLPLTVENVRGCKRFHPRCGTSFIFVIAIISIIVSIVIALIFPQLKEQNMKLIWMLIKVFCILPVVTSIGYEFIKYAGRHDNLFTRILSAPGLWMQRITTKEPTDDMIEVAIASINAVITDNPEDDALK